MRAQLMAADIPLSVRLTPDEILANDLPDLTMDDREGDESLLADTSLSSAQSAGESSKMLSLYATVRISDFRMSNLPASALMRTTTDTPS